MPFTQILRLLAGNQLATLLQSVLNVAFHLVESGLVNQWAE